MKVKKLHADKFRKLQNVDINFGTQLTCLAGQNGVGKSTVLGILGNCGELNSDIGKHLNGNKFRSEWADIIKGEKPYDNSGTDLYTLYFDDVRNDGEIYNYKFVDSLPFRATWQSGNRFRLLPKELSNTRETSAKLEWPTYYLGLGRLYPIGESAEVDITDMEFSDYEKSYYLENHRSILSSMDEYKDSSSLSIKEAKGKKSSGIITNDYGALSNSAGQDNLSQILLSLLSFERLKQKLDNNYFGGLLLIDEIDSTLHPAAQNHLLDFLFKESNRLGVQIVFTTHSLTMLEHIKNFQNKSKKNSDKVTLQYFSTGRGKLEIKENPSISYIRNQLMISYNRQAVRTPVIIYTEDEVGRWMLKNILVQEPYKSMDFNIKLLEMFIGYNELLKLIREDYNYFNLNVITVLDPDVKKSDIHQGLKGSLYNYDEKLDNPKESVLVLPGAQYIEKEMWEYISNLDENDKFYYEPNLEDNGFYKQTLLDGGPTKKYSKGTKKDKIKAWFADNEDICTLAFPYWFNENQDICKHFMKRFISVYNNIAINSGRTIINIS